MQVLNSTFIECGDCGNFVEYDESDIQCTHELHDESSKIYSYKITYIECEYCRSRVILNKERISPGT
jgi:DNA-directed RNA polymerase subunit RPC12/RpoP